MDYDPKKDKNEKHHGVPESKNCMKTVVDCLFNGRLRRN